MFTSKPSIPCRNGGNYRSTTSDDTTSASFCTQVDTGTSKYYTSEDDDNDRKDKTRERISQLVVATNLTGASQPANFDVADSGDNFSNELASIDIKPNPGQLVESWVNGNHKATEFKETEDRLTYEPQSKRLRLAVPNETEDDVAPKCLQAQSEQRVACGLPSGNVSYHISDKDIASNRCKTEDTSW